MTTAEKTTEDRGTRKTLVGIVVSEKMQKTVVVKVERNVAHPIYKKIIRRSTHIKAHDETSDSHVGDTVKIMETRPMSREKRWRVVEVVQRAR